MDMKSIPLIIGLALCVSAAMPARADQFESSVEDGIAQMTRLRAAVSNDRTAPPSAPASDCSPMRLDGPGGSMAHVMPHDQGPYGICYAEAAVQMADAYRFSHGDANTNRETSVMSASIGLADKTVKKKDPFEGGETCTVIDFLRQNGGHDALAVGRCMLESEVDDAPAVQRLGLLYDSYQAELAAMPSGAAPAAVSELRGNYVSILERREPWVATIVPPIARNVLSDFFGYDRGRFMWSISSYKCFNVDRPQTLSFLPACGGNDDARVPRPGAESRALLDAQLAKPNPQPVEISYCAEVLGRADYPGVDRSTASATQCLGNEPWAGGHASLVIGRRMGNDNRCQYLIRNSWGVHPTPKSYSLPGGDGQPEKISHGPGHTYAPQWEFENGKGDIWVDADALAKSLLGVSYLE